VKTRSAGWWFCTVVWIVAIGNFVGFAIMSHVLGGDALNGRIEDGRYFLNQNGRLTEVSQAVFEYSRWHARSLFVTHPLAIVAGIVAYASGAEWAQPRRRS
jgi:hypothetical protein